MWNFEASRWIPDVGFGNEGAANGEEGGLEVVGYVEVFGVPARFEFGAGQDIVVEDIDR